MFDYNFIEMLEIIKLILRANNYNKYKNINIQYLDKNKILNYQYKNIYFGNIYIGQDAGGRSYINVYSDFFQYYVQWYKSF
jgi:hypothetical protein